MPARHGGEPALRLLSPAFRDQGRLGLRVQAECAEGSVHPVHAGSGGSHALEYVCVHDEAQLLVERQMRSRSPKGGMARKRDPSGVDFEGEQSGHAHGLATIRGVL